MNLDISIMNIGNHRVQHASVMDGIELLMGDEKADIIYSDPPWGEGNLAYWQTINVRHNLGATKQEVSHSLFMKRLFDIYKQYASDVVFVEYGQRWRDEIIMYGEHVGLYHCGHAEPKYRSGSKWLPLDLHKFSVMPSSKMTDWTKLNIAHTTGLATLLNAIEPCKKPGGIILDPCCGMGYTARAAVHFGMRFRGNELNAKRLQKTINFLTKQTAQQK